MATIRSFSFPNLTDDDLQTRVIDRWDRGEPITWSGTTVDSKRIRVIRVYLTDHAWEPGVDFNEFVREGEDQTNRWITGPAGQSAAPSAADEPATPLNDRRRVMVVYGRNRAARDATFAFLRSLGLLPIEWEEAVAETGMGSPHNLGAVRAAM